MWIEILQGAKEVAVAGAAIGAAVIAYFGLKTWRAQLRGGAEYEAARALLRTAYGVRDALKEVRRAGMSIDEMHGAAKEADVEWDPKSFDMSKAAIVAYANRWSRVQKALSDLDVACLEAEVLWGDEPIQVLAELRKCTHQLYSNLMLIVWEDRGIPIKWERRQELDEVLYSKSTDDFKDSFDKSVNEALKKVEQFARPKLSARTTQQIAPADPPPAGG